MKRWLIGLALIPSLLWAPSVWAASLQYVLPGTPVTFQDTGGTATLAFNGIATGNGRYSGQVNKGTGAQPDRFVWSCDISLQATNTPGNYVEIYVAWWKDATNGDGGLGTTAGTLTADKRRNLKRIGTATVDQGTANTVMRASGLTTIPTQYYSVAYWNSSGATFTATNNTSSCTFTPHPFQMQ